MVTKLGRSRPRSEAYRPGNDFSNTLRDTQTTHTDRHAAVTQSRGVIRSGQDSRFPREKAPAYAETFRYFLMRGEIVSSSTI